MRYYIIAGEASGDLHGSNLLKQLKLQDEHAVFRGWGGEKMQAEGMHLNKHYKELAFMGFAEVAMNLRTIMRNFDMVKNDIITFLPDVVILIDYPGFNLRLAKWLKAKGFRIYYYISPQLWAWKESRVKQVKRYVDRMFCILPFEKDFYTRHGIEVDFVGHPLLDAVNINASEKKSDSNIIALLPGSRKQEVSRMLPEMLKVAAHFPEYKFEIAGVKNLGETFYLPYLKYQNIAIVFDGTYALLERANVALVTSGTATLETALHDVPQVVCYKGNYLSYIIGRLLVKVPFISLVNLICGRKIVEELIQSQVNAANLKIHLQQLLSETKRKEILSGYAELRQKLGGKGASERAAKLMWNYLNPK